MSGAVIVSGARTPIGKLGSSLSCLPAVELGAWAIAEALRRASIMPDQVDYVAIGQVLQAGQGQNPAAGGGARRCPDGRAGGDGQ